MKNQEKQIEKAVVETANNEAPKMKGRPVNQNSKR